MNIESESTGQERERKSVAQKPSLLVADTEAPQ